MSDVVTVTVVLAVTVPAVAVNPAVVEFAATETEVGVVRAELVSEIATVTPPAGAALLSVTVQVLDAFGPRLLGLHASDETSVEAVRLTVALAELPLYVAVTVAL